MPESRPLLKALSYPCIMGILNVTPDSFSDGGLFVKKDAAVRHVQEMIAEGAAIIDVGGESTRPGAQAVSVEEELQRVIPVIETVRAESEILISVDTSKPEVMREAVQAGASIINDVRALREEGAMQAAADLGVSVCLMHMQGQPRTMQAHPHYDDVVKEVKAFLDERITACVQAGIAAENIILDPGFGFGKNLEHNLKLFKHLPDLIAMGYRVLVGVSRKSMIGKMLDERPADERVYASVALATQAFLMGVQILRVHDVAASMDALKMVKAVQQA